MIKRILVALSGTPYTISAIRHALDLACRHEAEITGVTIVDLKSVENVGPVPLGGGAAALELTEHRRSITEEHVEQTITEFEAACRKAGVGHSVHREEGDPFTKLRSLWRYHDLTIMEIKGLFEYGVLHNPDDEVIDLVRSGVRPIIAVAASYRDVNNVLIAYDGSHNAAQAMKRFVQAHPWPKAKLKIACFNLKSDEAESLLEDAANYCRIHGFEVETEAVEAAPRDAILDSARAWGTDLIVMGAPTKSKLRRFVLGDTCQHVISQSEITVCLTQ